MKSKIAIAAATVAFAGVSTAIAAPVTESEPNDSRATAQHISLASFTPNTDPNVYGNLPTASVSGAIDVLNDVDWYSFDGIAGETFYADIDDTPLAFDTYLGLFNSAGTLIGISDDTIAPTDPGTDPRDDTAGATSRASFLGSFTLPETGTYYISVTDWGNRPENRSGTGVTHELLTRPDGVESSVVWNNSEVVGAPVGGDGLLSSTGTNLDSRTGSYTLHLTTSAIPEPASLSLLGLGGLALLRRRRA